MGNVAFADELIEEIYATETAPEDDDIDEDGEEEVAVEPEVTHP